MNNFQINAEKGRKEWLARQGAAASTGGRATVYGTGLDDASTDMLTYLFQLSFRPYFSPAPDIDASSKAARSAVIRNPQSNISAFEVGGQNMDYSARWWLSGSTSAFEIVLSLPIQGYPFATEDCVVGPVSPAGIVELVRKTFSLNVSDAADVFRVSRPTIYQWAKLGAMEQIRSGRDRERLKKLNEIATVWSARPKLSGRWYDRPLESGQTILDLFKVENLDVSAFGRFHAEIEKQCEQLQRMEHIHASDAVVKLRQAMAAMEADRPKGKGEEEI